MGAIAPEGTIATAESRLATARRPPVTERTRAPGALPALDGFPPSLGFVTLPPRTPSTSLALLLTMWRGATAPPPLLS